MRYIIAMLLAGFALAFALGLKKGFGARELGRLARNGAREALGLGVTLLVIGALTAVWRLSGTLALCVRCGIEAITPRAFLLVTFAVTCGISYAIGTSFGVAGTAGVVFITLARGGGVDTAVAAGAILSGIYFGDRGSPVSSSALMVSQVTKTDLYGNVRRMFKTGFAPLLAATAFYAFLSVKNPLGALDAASVAAFSGRFSSSPWALLPAVLILCLPPLGARLVHTLAASVVSGAFVARFAQGFSWGEIARSAALGYRSGESGMAAILDGGGLTSMLGVAAVVAISCALAGLLDGTGTLDAPRRRVENLCARLGCFPAMTLVSLVSSALFCNQSVAIVTCGAFLGRAYERAGKSREDLAADIENSAILLPALIPWCLPCSVPLAVLGASYAAVPYAVYVYAVPLFTLAARAFSERRGRGPLT